MDNLDENDFNDIELIASYIDGKITNKDEKELLNKKLKTDKVFREKYTIAYEYLKDIENRNLLNVPDELKKYISSNKKKLVFKVIKNIVEIISNTIDNIKPKEFVLEYLSEEDNKVISQKFNFKNSIIEIKGQESNNAEIIIDSPIGTHINFKNISDGLIIIDIDTINDITTLQNIEKGSYNLMIENEEIIIEIC